MERSPLCLYFRELMINQLVDCSQMFITQSKGCFPFKSLKLQHEGCSSSPNMVLMSSNHCFQVLAAADLPCWEIMSFFFFFLLCLKVTDYKLYLLMRIMLMVRGTKVKCSVKRRTEGRTALNHKRVCVCVCVCVCWEEGVKVLKLLLTGPYLLHTFQLLL